MKSALKAENQRVYGEDLSLYIRTNGRYNSEFKKFAFEAFRDIAKKPSEESPMRQSLEVLLILIHECLGEGYRSAKST